MHSLHALFHPTSVALIGASSDPERIGGRPLRFMLENGFEPPLYPVNRSGDTIQGLPAFASVRDIPHPVDHAIVCVPAAGVEAAVRDSIAKGVRAIQVLTAGFAEIDAEGRATQERLAAMCRDAGVRMLGPNSLGLLNVETRFFATFSTALNGLKPRPGGIALATQSGAFGSAAYGMASSRPATRRTSTSPNASTTWPATTPRRSSARRSNRAATATGCAARCSRPRPPASRCWS